MNAPYPPVRRPVLRHARPAAIAIALIALAALGVLWRVRPSVLRRFGAAPISTALASVAGSTQAAGEKRKPNRLIKSTSPYLLQHAHNPVDWYPWGDEAFEKARREEKPIFLSIGYSTCHWCHVMERESFENDSVAALLNQYFVAIKVDREERPDVDRLYMSAMNAMGMGGGWPLNVFLTPELKPFFGGTYFPPHTLQGRPGLMEVLPRIHEAWIEQRGAIDSSGDRVFAALAALGAVEPGATHREALFDSCYQVLARSYDEDEGGFGSAPKFPSISNLNFLLRYWERDPAHHAQAREMALRQLDRMRAGGIHDQLGGGFHRYSTDRSWLAPHFEKMLYDQAQMVWAYLEGYQVAGQAEYAATARDVLGYVARDLSSSAGGFYSAEDADSEGEEGKFYLWTRVEIETELGPKEAPLFEWFFDVTLNGNFEHGTSILHHAHTLDDAAQHFGATPAEIELRLAAARARLLEARARRVRPHLDDKVLTAWNGLMISAFARGARVLDDPALAERAARAAEFIWAHLRDAETGALERSWREGTVSAAAQLDDYAYYALGLIDLYGATHNPRWLERAVSITEKQIASFWDEKDGGFFESPAGDSHLRVRMKDGFDGSEMAGNSIAAYNLQLLAVLLDRRDWRAKAERTFDYFARRLAGSAAAMPQMLVAMDLEQSAPRHIVIAGSEAAADTRTMIREFDRRFLPHDLLLLTETGAGHNGLAKLVPFLAPLVAQNGKATAYVCANYACKLPTTDAHTFAAQLDERPAGAIAKERR